MAAEKVAMLEVATPTFSNVSHTGKDHCSDMKEATMVPTQNVQKNNQSATKSTRKTKRKAAKEISVDLGNDNESTLALKDERPNKKKRFEKGIINTKRAKNSSQWRPKIHKYNGKSSPDPSRKVLINNCHLTLRQCRSFVMFEIESFANVISKSLPLKMDLETVSKMVSNYAKARRPQMAAEAKAWRHEFLSWKSFKHFLEHNLHDQCVRDILRTYVPQNAELKFDGSLGLNDAPVTFLGNSETDFVKMAGVTIPFMVKCGRIYFDLFPAFTLMGQLQVALKSEWREIDGMLVEQGFNLRTAFR